jgi:hypothetical protein
LLFSSRAIRRSRIHQRGHLYRSSSTRACIIADGSIGNAPRSPRSPKFDDPTSDSIEFELDLEDVERLQGQKIASRSRPLACPLRRQRAISGATCRRIDKRSHLPAAYRIERPIN